MDRNWDGDKFDPEDLKHTVQKVHLCAYINEHNEGDGEEPPTNHWATFLEISPTHSVMMDMAPGYGSDGLRGKIELSTERYKYPDDTIHVVSLEPAGKPTVQDIVGLINDNGLQKYTFTPEWEGCRFWVFTVVSNLEKKGSVPPGSAEATWKAVSYYYRNPSGHEPRIVRQGTFRSSE
ncbi:hypothetical protein SEPCBS119000_000326 [Sporothrix epigloea]|uniref:DUF7770 domain-containing protein n=1 Tax=Sporothrix epigloea TaxID=1892477 RepID=A0ABP0D885_9PEZI